MVPVLMNSSCLTQDLEPLFYDFDGMTAFHAWNDFPNDFYHLIVMTTFVDEIDDMNDHGNIYLNSCELYQVLFKTVSPSSTSDC